MPSKESPYDHLKAELALVALNGIYISALSQNMSLANVKLTRSFAAAWPDMWLWMEYLYYQTHRIPPDGPHASVTFDSAFIYKVILQLISLFMFRPGVKGALDATPSLVPLMADMWARHLNDESLPMDSVDLNRTMAIFLGPHPDRVHQFVQVVGKDLDEVATLFLKQLRMASRGDMAYKLYSLVTIFVGLVTSLTPQLTNILLARNLVVDLCRGVTFFTSKQITDSHARELVQCMESAFQYLLMATTTTDGFTWVIQALRTVYCHPFSDPRGGTPSRTMSAETSS